MAYYSDEPDAGLDWYTAEVKRHEATKAERDALRVEVEAMRLAMAGLCYSTGETPEAGDLVVGAHVGPAANIVGPWIVVSGIPCLMARTSETGDFVPHRIGSLALRTRKGGV